MRTVTAPTTANRVREIIEDKLRISAGNLEASLLVEDCGMDSLDLLNITGQIEDDFGIAIPEHDASAWRTIGDVTRYVEERGK